MKRSVSGVEVLCDPARLAVVVVEACVCGQKGTASELLRRLDQHHESDSARLSPLPEGDGLKRNARTEILL
ncbi:hypothetical protein DQ04_01581030 [Trypanosoma grayi]|uniref:hypothetical protein n=1 Tax=Trypanosoma grayi TaxID=71804 RepID=UPI0004F48E51|nr:hypothetical protein DQ04_01581030 [Trypanosoma grayi]KEG12606.1 hypothetical protein DQ04_01581030 [Trypanosoma grayi]